MRANASNKERGYEGLSRISQGRKRHAVSDLASLTVDGRPVSVSSTEFALARALFEEPGAIVTLERSYSVLGSTGARETAANLLNVFIHRVRRKLRNARARANLATVRGRAYMVTAPSAAEVSNRMRESHRKRPKGS